MEKRGYLALGLVILLIGFFSTQSNDLTGRLADNVGFRGAEGVSPPLFEQVTRFAVIGDFGADQYGSSAPLCGGALCEKKVADLVKSWNVDFIITTGDNNYPRGAWSTIDANIGRYYHDYIYPYTCTVCTSGSGSPATKGNRFWPSLGNHDWNSLQLSGGHPTGPYTDYFMLPGNEDYYDFVVGNIHFFALDSDKRAWSLRTCDPSNRPINDPCSGDQDDWLRNALANSQEPFNVVYFHHSPYSSGRHGNDPRMQWPFKQWGADVVLTGHDHGYERLYVGGLDYFVNGAGGAQLYEFTAISTGSQLRYKDKHGAILVEVDNTKAKFQFITWDGNVIDTHRVAV